MAWVLGVEIGGTKLQLGLARPAGRIEALEHLPVRPAGGAAAIRDQILEGLPALLDQVGAARDDLPAAGIGFGGPVDAEQGRCITSHHVAGWDGFPLADWARSALGVGRAAVGNDSDLAALAEARHGAGVGCSPLLYVNSGSGVGGGLVVGGRLYPGNGAGAIEIGHLILDGFRRGPEGTPRTLESLASGWSIARAAAGRLAGVPRPVGPLADLCGGDPARISAELVARAAEDGDPTALDVLDRATRAMGRALAHAVTLLAPRRIVLGGGVSEMPHRLWLDPIRTELDRRVFPPFRGTYDLVPAALGTRVVVQGAADLAGDLLADPPA